MDVKLPTAIRLVDPTTLKPAPVNPRTHSPEQIKRIEASIREFGWTNPILVDAAGNVVAGHARQQAAVNMGLAEVPVIDVGYLTSEQVRAYVIADNKLALDAGWDAAALKAELDALDKIGYDTALTGFTGTEIDELLAGLDGGEVVEDEPPEPPPVAVSRRGDLWLCGRHRVLCGDSTNAEDVARVMAGEKAKLYNTDPPYGVDYTATKNGIPRNGFEHITEDWGDIQQDDLKDAKLQEFLESVFRTVLPHLDHAAWYLWHAQMTQGYFAAAAAAAAAAVLIHRQIIWVKPGFVLTRSGMYHWKHELCFYGWVQGQQPAWLGSKNQTSVWEIGRDGDKEHPTQKPVELFAIPIRNHLRKGEVCVDTFLGSGSQIIAAEQLDVRCFGLEIEPRYVDASVTRWANLTHAEPVLDGDGRTFAAVAAERRDAGA